MSTIKHSKSLFSTWVAVFVSLGSTVCGYATAITATTLAQPSFRVYMHLDTDPNASELMGAVNGVYIAGALIGSVASSWLSDSFGRKMSVFVAAAFVIVGGALQAGSVDIGMFIAARLISGLGIGSVFTVVPLYQSEVSPPKTRGFTVGLHGLFITVGYCSSNWIGFAFYFVDAKGAQFRPPLALQCLPPLILAAGIWFMPESPRWLMVKGRNEEAVRILERLHRDGSDPEHHFAHREYAQIKEQHEEDEKNKVTWKQMWTVPSYRRRTALAAFIMFGSQMSITLITAIYSPTLFGSLGYDTEKQLLFAGVYATVALCGNTWNAFTVDWSGRVFSLKVGWIGDAFAMIGVIVSLAKFQSTGSHASAIAGIFFLYLHIAFFASCVDVTTYVYCAEIFPNNIRGKGMSVALATYFTTLVVELDSAPTALANIGWKLIVVYLCFLVVCIPGLFFLCPETKGKSLEEVGLVFGDRHLHVDLEGSNEKFEVGISMKHDENQETRQGGEKPEYVQGSKLEHE